MKKMSLLIALLLCIATILAISASARIKKETTNVYVSAGKLYINLKDADIKNALQIFGKATGKNIVFSDDIKGKVSITFSGISPKEGMEAVLRAKGLDWSEEGDTIYVSNTRGLHSFKLMNAKPSDLQATLVTILPTGSTISADDCYNSLVIQTTSDFLPRLNSLIKDLDVSPQQVMVEAKLIEIQRSNDTTLGFDAGYARGSSNIETLNLAGRRTADEPQGLYAHVLSIMSAASLEAYISALTTNKKVNIIASPRITTINNKEASLLIGSKLGYKTTVTTPTGTSQVMNFLSVGTSLILTPNVTRNGYIRMKVAPKISDGSVANDIPLEETTETVNEVLVEDGQTFVIGGLIKEKENITDYGIPLLMDIPILGAFFRKSVPSTEKSELLVFVTPHIVTSDYLKEMNAPIREMENRSSEQKANLIH